MTARRKEACSACLRVVAVRTRVQSLAGRGGKHRVPHMCPHGNVCIAGTKMANNGWNPGSGHHSLLCPICSAERQAESRQRSGT